MKGNWKVEYMRVRKDGRVERTGAEELALTDEQACALSRLATVASVRSLRATANERFNLYIGGAAVQYDPVTRELVGKFAEFDPRLGWVS